MSEKKDNVIDLSEFVTQDNAEKGVWFDLVIGGRTTGVEINVLGKDSERVAIYAKKAEKRMTKMFQSALTGKKNTFDADDEEEARRDIDDRIDSAVVRTNGIRKKGGGIVVVNGQEIGQDEESYRYFYRLIRDAVDFVIDKSADRSNFLSGRKKS